MAKIIAFDEEARKLLIEMAMDISFALGNFAREAERLHSAKALCASEARDKTCQGSGAKAHLLLAHAAIVEADADRGLDLLLDSVFSPHRRRFKRLR